jgi:hypothetical protein
MNQLKNLIEEMLVFYRENDCFEPWQLNQILNLAEFQTTEVNDLIQKFYMINTTIASNGGVPVLKQVYNIVGGY